MGVQSKKVEAALPALSGSVGWLEWYRGKIAWRWYDQRIGEKRRRSCRTVDPVAASRLAVKWGADYLQELKDGPAAAEPEATCITLGEAALGYLREAAQRLRRLAHSKPSRPIC